MAYVSFPQLDACMTAAEAALKADPAKYRETLTRLGSDEAIYQMLADACLKQLSSQVSAEELKACIGAVKAKMAADPAVIAQFVKEAGGAEKVAQFVVAQCLDQLQRAKGLTPPVEEKKTPWGWILGGTAALAAVVGVAYVATKDSKYIERKPNPTGRPKKWYGAYEIVRMYQNPDKPSRVIDVVATLGAAQVHCRNPETSSSTATSAAAKARTRKYGPWFDGYQKHYESRSYDPPKSLGDD